MLRTFGDDHRMKVSTDKERKLALFDQTIDPHLNAADNLAAWLTRNKDDAEDSFKKPTCAPSGFSKGSVAATGKLGCSQLSEILARPGYAGRKAIGAW